MIKNQEEYMDENYVNSIKKMISYYNFRSKKYKRIFFILSLFQLSASSIIPIVVLANTINWSSIVTAILASIGAISGGVLLMTKSKEKWISYRSTCDLLMSEIRKYKSGCDGNNDDSVRLSKLIMNCEIIMKAESLQWSKYIEDIK